MVAMESTAMALLLVVCVLISSNFVPYSLENMVKGIDYRSIQADKIGTLEMMEYDYRYCTFSTNNTAQIFHMANNKRIEVYDTSSDVFVYDTQEHVAIKVSLFHYHAHSQLSAGL